LTREHESRTGSPPVSYPRGPLRSRSLYDLRSMEGCEGTAGALREALCQAVCCGQCGILEGGMDDHGQWIRCRKADGGWLDGAGIVVARLGDLRRCIGCAVQRSGLGRYRLKKRTSHSRKPRKRLRSIDFFSNLLVPRRRSLHSSTARATFVVVALLPTERREGEDETLSPSITFSTLLPAGGTVTSSTRGRCRRCSVFRSQARSRSSVTPFFSAQ
jgi:hypothetical protein